MFLADKGSETAEVFIEVKNLGKLKSDLDAAEDQLQRYNYYDRAAINILTDGNTWRFYYSLATGTFANGLFNEFYLLEDDLESIAIFLQRILSRKNFPIQAITTAGDMYREFGMIRKIQAIKGEAIKIADSIKMDEHETAQRLLKTKENAEIDLETIKRLWDRNIPICDQKAEESPSLSVPALSMDDNVIPVFMKSKGCLAKGLFNLKTRETIILKDSEAATQNAPSFSGYEFEYKSRLIEAGDLYLNGSVSNVGVKLSSTF